MPNLEQLDSVPTRCTVSLPHTALSERLRIVIEAARVGRTALFYEELYLPCKKRSHTVTAQLPRLHTPNITSSQR